MASGKNKEVYKAAGICLSLEDGSGLCEKHTASHLCQFLKEEKQMKMRTLWK